MSAGTASPRTFLRMRDVALALCEARRYQEALSKTQLQKFVYLVDAVTLLYSLLPARIGHQTYKHGPWDSAIQNAADCLVFRGLAKLASVRRGPHNEVFLRYDLTQAGLRWTETLLRSSSGQNRSRIIVAVAVQVNIYGWSRLKELVYAEPSYAFSRHRGYGQSLALVDPEKNSAGHLIRLIARTIRQGWGEIEISPEVVVGLFFQYLDKYSALVSRQKLASEDKGIIE